LQQRWQLGDVGRNAPGLVAAQQVPTGARGSTEGFELTTIDRSGGTRAGRPRVPGNIRRRSVVYRTRKIAPAESSKRRSLPLLWQARRSLRRLRFGSGDTDGTGKA
jgi:hypothetical protein